VSESPLDLARRGPRLLGGGGGRSQARGAALSTASTLVVVAVIAALFLLAPGSAQVRHTFFSPADLRQSLIGNPGKGYYSVGAAIWLNIRMFLAAEVFILAAEIYSATVFNYSSYVVAAVLFLILTIPLARFTDRLIARDRARRLAGGAR
jgi:hypothetical protein